MISTLEFKKSISKILSENLKQLGFKGSGFNYLMDTDNFVFAIGIQASQFGAQCCVEFGFQPKSLVTDGFKLLDYKKLRYYNCEFRTRITPNGQSDYWWKYSENEYQNIQIANQITELIIKRALPIVQLLKVNPNHLETIEPKDLDNIYTILSDKLLGMNLATTDIRLAWVFAMSLTKTNLKKSKRFAEYGLSKLTSSDKFFGRRDFEAILNDASTTLNQKEVF